MKKVQVNEITREYEPCSDTSICSQESEVSAWQQSNLGEYEQLSLLKSTPMHSEFSDTTSHISPSTPTSETTTQSQESLKSSQWDFPAQAQVTQELSKDSNIQLPLSGEKDLDVLSKLNPASVLWNSLKDLSEEDLELFLPVSIWQDTVLRLKQSRRESLDYRTRDSEYLSFPTLTSNECSTSRPAGQTKCEKWFKDNGLIPSGYQLSAQAIAMIMGFPSNWFEVLSQKNSKNLITPNQVKPQEESEQDISQVEPLHQHKQRSLLEEFSISIPCLVKQPKQPEVKGIIQKDLGDRFDVYIPHLDKSIAYLKLFVYPDFDKSDEQIPPSNEITPPSKGVILVSRQNVDRPHPKGKNSPTKQRRKKGDGTGYIYRRTITRKGKQYQESYYRYRDESGKLKAKYIPQRLLCKVEQAESLKKPIADILVLLGGDEISRGEHSSTSDDRCVRREASPLGQNEGKSDEPISISRGEQITPPSTRRCDPASAQDAKERAPRQRRKQGYGAGYIECKPIKRSGKEYKQYWYHYEIWRKGDRTSKKSRYIPKRLVQKIESLNIQHLRHKNSGKYQ